MVNGHVIERSLYVSDIVLLRRFVVKSFLQQYTHKSLKLTGSKKSVFDFNEHLDYNF